MKNARGGVAMLALFASPVVAQTAPTALEMTTHQALVALNGLQQLDSYSDAGSTRLYRYSVPEAQDRARY